MIGMVRHHPMETAPMTRPKAKPVVRLRRSGHQPTKAEMEEDVSIDATPEAVARRAHAGQDRIQGRCLIGEIVTLLPNPQNTRPIIIPRVL